MTKPAINSTTVSGWTQLIDELYRDSWDEDIRRFRSPFVFRGLPSICCDLSTSLIRAGGPNTDLARLEGHLLRNFRKYAHADAATSGSIWNWLAIAQHHGLPTRLLDWTYSPFIALHFVTEGILNDRSEDGIVWCVNHRQAKRLLPPVLREQAEDAGLDVFTAEMLEQAAGSLSELDNLAKEVFLLFLEPPSVDARIANQLALFSLMSSPSEPLDQWLADHPDLVRTIIIPAALKWEVRDKLDQAGVTERVLYPGLDGLARWLCRYYSPVPAPARE